MAINLEEYSMMIVTFSGVAKSAALEAIDLAEEGKDTTEKLKEVEEALQMAGQKHFEILGASANEKIELDILFIHAEDQMLNAETTFELAKKMIRMYKKIYGK